VNREPDLALARRCLQTHPPPGRLVLFGVTGSHLYGFASPDSDLDLKGIHVAPLEEILGFGVPQETFNFLGEVEATECDVTSNEARQAVSLLLQGNGNMLERILSAYQLIETEETATLQTLAMASISRGVFRHYAGFFRQMCKEHERSPSVKSMLYSYRVALTGTRLLQAGELVADLRPLALEYGFPEALDLVALKAFGHEREPLPEELDVRHRANWQRLDDLLTAAHAASKLPELPPNRQACEAWLIATRDRVRAQ